MHTKINVVIPVYRPDEKLIQLFTMLNKQTIAVSKVIVMNTVVGSMSDNVDGRDGRAASIIGECRKLCKTNLEVVHVYPENFDHGGTRALAVSYAEDDCDYLLFMTQDAVPENEYLVEKLLEPFISDSFAGLDESASSKIAAAYARQLPSKDSSLSECFTRGFNYPDVETVKTAEDIEKIGIKAFFCSNVCAMYKKSVYESLGGFVKRTIFNEDMIFANKLLKKGYNIAYASKATVIHTHNYSGKQQYKRNFDLAVSQTLNPQAFSGISSESEGIKYVKAAFIYFIKAGKPFEIIPFGINCVYKYLGYKKGKNIADLKYDEIMKCTSNPGFFDNVRPGKDIVDRAMKVNGISQ